MSTSSEAYKFESNQLDSPALNAAAGASAGEIWKTSSHATLPDNVLLIGI